MVGVFELLWFIIWLTFFLLWFHLQNIDIVSQHLWVIYRYTFTCQKWWRIRFWCQLFWISLWLFFVLKLLSSHHCKQAFGLAVIGILLLLRFVFEFDLADGIYVIVESNPFFYTILSLIRITTAISIMFFYKSVWEVLDISHLPQV